jgi:hypothetical protein
MMILAACNTYCVDLVPHRSAEIVAANNCVRYLFSAGASIVALPLIQRIGVAGTNALAAGLAWMGFGLVLLIVYKGPRMRRSLDKMVEVERKRVEEEKEEKRLADVEKEAAIESEGDITLPPPPPTKTSASQGSTTTASDETVTESK